jgi:uncharacterized membrane protein
MNIYCTLHFMIPNTAYGILCYIYNVVKTVLYLIIDKISYWFLVDYAAEFSFVLRVWLCIRINIFSTVGSLMLSEVKRLHFTIYYSLQVGL